MDPIAHLALRPDENAKLTPLEVLADFADATRGWVYEERASRHYAEQKDTPALVLRHWRSEPPTHVDFAFAIEPDDTNRVSLVILDAPDAEDPLSREERGALVETFLDALRGYLGEEASHVQLEVEREAAT